MDDNSSMEQDSHSEAIAQTVYTFPWQPTRRRRDLSEPFFDEGNIVCSLCYKHIKDVEESDEEDIYRRDEFACQMPGCRKVFSDVTSYEMHYNSVHKNHCTTCKRTFPTAHLLDIHVLEWHDSMFPLLADKQLMYQCLLEACPEKFKTSHDRKEHMIKVHRYPANFRFDRHRSPKKKKDASESVTSMEVEKMKDQAAPQRLTDQPMSTDGPSPAGHKFVYKVPKNICFGKGAQRSFQRPPSTSKHKGKKKHWHQTDKTAAMDTTVNIEEVKMADLEEALN